MTIPSTDSLHLGSFLHRHSQQPVMSSYLRLVSDGYWSLVVPASCSAGAPSIDSSSSLELHENLSMAVETASYLAVID